MSPLLRGTGPHPRGLGCKWSPSQSAIAANALVDRYSHTAGLTETIFYGRETMLMSNSQPASKHCFGRGLWRRKTESRHGVRDTSRD